MEPSLNLTPERGPSVWTERTTRSSVAPIAAAAGVALVALAWRASPARRFWIAGLGTAGAVAALLSGPLGDCADRALAGAKARVRGRRREPLDDTLNDSFPASDAPAVW